MSAAVCPAIAFAVVAVAAPLAAQTAAVRGDVIDRTSNLPVPAVEVTLHRNDSIVGAARTDDAGRFSILRVAPGTVLVRARRLGFSHRDVELEVAPGLQPLRLYVDAAAAQLDSVEVEGDAGAAAKLASYRLRRDAKRQGIFMERDDFPRNAAYLSEVFRRIPGAQLRAGTIGSSVRLRNCRPALWVDGIKMDNAELDDAVSVHDVAAIEVYTSLPQAPPQYQDRDTRCGSVLVWLR